MPITLSGTRITVTKETVKGNSWDDAYTMDDIYAAAIAGGWDIVLQGNKTYNINSYSIWVSNLTYLKITSCILNFYGTPVDNQLIYRNTSGMIQFGEFDGTKVSQGCVINVNTSNAKRLYMYTAYDTTFIGKYFMPDYTKANINGIYAFGGMKGCKIMNSSTETFYNHLVNLDNCIVSNCYYGTRSPASGSIFENVAFNNCYIGIWLYQCNNVTLTNVDARGNSISIRNQSYLNNSQENTLIGCLYDSYDNRFTKQGTESMDSYCILNIAEVFNLYVTDSDGKALENANVKLYDKNNDLAFEVLTDENGDIEEQIVRKIRDEIWKLAENSFNPVRTIYTYNPFTLIIEYAGKQLYESTLTISGSKELEISLLDIIPPVYIQQEIDGSITSPGLSGSITQDILVGEIKGAELSGTIEQTALQGSIIIPSLKGDIY